MCLQQTLRVSLRPRVAERRPVAFRPEHEHKLGNEFLLYTDAEGVADALGGWEPTAQDEPTPALSEGPGQA